MKYTKILVFSRLLTIVAPVWSLWPTYKRKLNFFWQIVQKLCRTPGVRYPFIVKSLILVQKYQVNTFFEKHIYLNWVEKSTVLQPWYIVLASKLIQHPWENFYHHSEANGNCSQYSCRGVLFMFCQSPNNDDFACTFK